MRNYLLIIAGICFSLSVFGQSRTDITQFSLLQHYFNPALTGQQGSVVKSLYRNQWTGFEDAPKTIIASGEFALDDLRSKDIRGNARKGENYNGHALGLSVLHNSFGPYATTQVNLNFGSAIRLSENLNLRWGTALTYTSDRLDGTKLSVAGDDPKYQHLLGQNNKKSKVDMNLGLALTAENFYVAYAMQDIMKEGIINSGDDFFKDSYSRKHIVQAGYRVSLSDEFGIVLNSIYVNDKLQEQTLEGQAKAVYKNMFWAGGGYRKDLAYNLTAGLRLKQLQLGYAYEMPAGDETAIPNNTNEIVISYHLFPVKSAARDGGLTIW